MNNKSKSETSVLCWDSLWSDMLQSETVPASTTAGATHQSRLLVSGAVVVYLLLFYWFSLLSEAWI